MRACPMVPMRAERCARNHLGVETQNQLRLVAEISKQTPRRFTAAREELRDPDAVFFSAGPLPRRSEAGKLITFNSQRNSSAMLLSTKEGMGAIRNPKRRVRVFIYWRMIMPWRRVLVRVLWWHSFSDSLLQSEPSE